MDKYTAYPNLYELITQIDNDTVCTGNESSAPNVNSTATGVTQIRHSFCSLFALRSKEKKGGLEFSVSGTIRQNLQKLISIILQNAEYLSLTSGQIKLAFCFIIKVKPVLYDVTQSLKIIQSELLVDYLPAQLTKLDKLLSYNKDEIVISNSPRIKLDLELSVSGINNNEPINNYPLPDILKRLENINNVCTGIESPDRGTVCTGNESSAQCNATGVTPNLRPPGMGLEFSVSGTVTTQEQYNDILLASCHYVESSSQILNNPIISNLVNQWFHLDKMFL